jgi:hypothetical protein
MATLKLYTRHLKKTASDPAPAFERLKIPKYSLHDSKIPISPHFCFIVF